MTNREISSFSLDEQLGDKQILAFCKHEESFIP